MFLAPFCSDRQKSVQQCRVERNRAVIFQPFSFVLVWRLHVIQKKPRTVTSIIKPLVFLEVSVGWHRLIYAIVEHLLMVRCRTITDNHFLLHSVRVVITCRSKTSLNAPIVEYNLIWSVYKNSQNQHQVSFCSVRHVRNNLFYFLSFYLSA